MRPEISLTPFLAILLLLLLLLGARWVFEALPPRAGAFGDAEEEVDDIGVETSCESVTVGPRLCPVGVRVWVRG